MPPGRFAAVAVLVGSACSSEPPIDTGPSTASGDAGDDRAPDDDGPTSDDEEPSSDDGEPGESDDDAPGEPRRPPRVDPGSDSCPASASRCDALGDERPDRLSEHSAVYDPERLTMIVFGGTPSIPANCAPGAVEFTRELWFYDDPCGRWRQLGSSGPGPRGRHMATFGGGRMWLFGGRYREGSSGPYELYYDLWAFDPEQESWAEMPSGAQRPTARVNAALVFDPGRQALWLMGGNQSEHGTAYLPTNDVWSYSLEDQSWQQHNVSVGPSPRLFHAALFDPERDRLVIFGGADEDAFTGAGGYFSDLWALDLESLDWEQLAGALAGPRGRFWSQLVYETESNAYLLFGGHDDDVLGNRNDTWRFDLELGRWGALGSEDTFLTEPRGTCDFPPDFAQVDLALPERRNSHTLVWSEGCGHALLFAGKTDCGSADDVWRWSGSEWQERSRAREGEACLRWREDPSECTDICF